ncbi:MAG: helix-hairpin-helix domain-containing protein [Porticoccaceae bacterium]
MKKVHGFERIALVALALGLAPAPLWAAESKAGSDKPPAVATQAAAKATAKAESAINVNTASAEQIAAGLVGVGPAKAQAIVAYRETNGPFKDAAQLLEVKGIGDAILKQNEARIAF